MIYGSKSLRNICRHKWHKHTFNDDHMGVLEKLDMVSYRSHILSYGVGPLETRGVNPKVADFIRGHCSASMRLRAMALNAYEWIGASLNYPEWGSVYTATFTSLTSSISSVDSLSCVLWALLYNEVPRRHPDLIELKCKMVKEGHPMAGAIKNLVDANWFQKLKWARDSLVHRGVRPYLNNDGSIFMKAENGLFAIDFGYSKKAENLGDNVNCIDAFELGGNIAGLLVDLEDWEEAIALELTKYSCYQSFMDDALLITVCVDGHRIMYDPFMTEQFSKKPSKEYLNWLMDKRQKQGLDS